MTLNAGIKALGLIILLCLPSGCSREVEIQITAPDFTLLDLSGNPVSLKNYRGRIVLLDFWATWCPPCQVSIPELVGLQSKYGDRGFTVLGISLDEPQVNNRILQAFKEQFRINYPILRADHNVTRDYIGNGQVSIPTMVVIDRKGRIFERIVGFVPGTIERSLEKLLG